MKNNVFRIDIYKYFFALIELKMYIENKGSLKQINEKINIRVTKKGFEELFKFEELTEERVSKLTNCVGNAIFRKNQKYYFTKYSDIFSIFIASTSISSDKETLLEYIKTNLTNNSHQEWLKYFNNLFNKKYPIYKKEINKIEFYMERRIKKQEEIRN